MRLIANVLTGLVAVSHIGFLAAGLIWGLFSGWRDVMVFFLCCVVIAGVFGGITVKPTILPRGPRQAVNLLTMKDRLGAVVTSQGYSDRSTQSFPASARDVWLRVRREGQDYIVDASGDGRDREQIRMARLTVTPGRAR